MAHLAFGAEVVNEIERARISMMARSSKAPSIGRIQKRKTNFSKSPFSACNARPVHTDGPATDSRTAANSDLSDHFVGTPQPLRVLRFDVSAIGGPVEAERRQVTVLFTDMVGFTTFSERSGEEAAFYADAQPVEADGRSRARAGRRRSGLYRRRHHGGLRRAGRL